ncbi:hypothetical protein D3C85_1168920 [compost metagenome]
MRTRENHPRKQFIRLVACRFQAGLGKQVPRGGTGVNEGERAPLEIGQLLDATVLTRQDLAVIGAGAGLTGHGHGKCLHTGHLVGQHVRERPQVRHIQLAGAQRLDDTVVVGGHEGLDRHAQLLLQVIEHLLAAFDHGLGIFGRDQANAQRVLRNDVGAGEQG